MRWLTPLSHWAVNSGHYGFVMALCHRDVVARMAGDTPLSGTYASRAAYRSWFERVASMCTLRLAVQSVQVTGTIRNTHLVVAWTDRVTMRDGAAFTGSGRHIAQLRWSRIRSISHDWDVETVQAACDHAARSAG